MTIGTRQRWVAIGIASAIGLTGCGDDSPSEAVRTSESPTLEGEAFPVTVAGANGDVTVTSQPQRIIVLSASLTEMVYAIGAGDQVVAVDSYSDHPAGTPVTDLSAFRPNVEAIGAYEPDLVLVARDTDGLVDSLTSVGIPSLVLPSAVDLDEVGEQIETIGAATGHESAASELSTALRSEIDAQFERGSGAAAGETYFYEMSDDYRTLTSDTFVGSIFSGLGMVNIADGVDPGAGAYPQLSAEFVLAENPDRIFVAHTDGSEPTLDELAARPGWDRLDAVVDGKVTRLDVEIASRWGPRITEVVASVVDAVMGDDATS